MSEAAREILPENISAPEISSEKTPDLPMRWHGFLVKFYLWLAAAYHLFQSACFFTGKIYIEPTARDAVYTSMPGMRILDCSFAALLAIGSLLLVFSAVRLIRKRKSGISLLASAYILLILSIVFYLTARMFISGMPPMNLPFIGQIVSYLALLGINRSYYRKRF